jgi:polyhydroxybutyrate depolymerase
LETFRELESDARSRDHSGGLAMNFRLRSTVRLTSSIRHLASIGLAIVLLAGTAAAGFARGNKIVIPTRDGPRTAIVLASRPAPQPTIIVLHGATMTAESTIRVSGFAEAVAAHGFTAVFPQGLQRQWNDERAGGPGGADDVSFLSALVDRLVRDGVASPGHIYLAGISNGGMMSFTMACKAGSLFRGIGTVIANMPAGLARCDLPALPLLMINGTADPLVPYEGGGVGFMGGRGDVWSVKRTAELFIRRNGCRGHDEQVLPSRSSFDATTTTRLTWSSCQSGKSVTLYKVNGGGHQISGERAFLPRMLGRSSGDFRAADEIVEMFAREERSGALL